MAACPPLEDIAAFIDGITLSSEERARITEHLAKCERCYEIFSGAVHFQEQEQEEEEEPSVAAAATLVHQTGERRDDDTGGRGVLPFPLAQEKNQETKIRVEPVRPPRRVSRWLGLAASVVLVSALGFMISQRSRALPDITVAGVVEPLPNRPSLLKDLYQPEDVERSGDVPGAIISPAPPFLVGVYLVDLRLSVQSGPVETTQNILPSLSGTLDQMMLIAPDSTSFFKDRAKEELDEAALARLAKDLPKQESALQNELAEEPFFRFGLWTEAGRLSALAKSPEFFKRRVNRRFLSNIPREISSEGDDRYNSILDNLQKIEPLWDRDKRSREDYDALAQHFEKIIRRVEQIQKEDQEELGLSP